MPRKQTHYVPASRAKVLSLMAALYVHNKKPVEAQGHLAELVTHIAAGVAIADR